MSEFILSVDQGTTSSRAMIFDQTGQVNHIEQQEFNQIYPQSGWVEHDPEILWDTTVNVCKAALNNSGLTIKTMAICNQRETTIVWDKHTGKPIYNAIVWQDRRTSEYCESLKQAGQEPIINQKTGLLLDPYFSATKLKWILDNVEGARQKAAEGDLLFGTVDTFLVWRLTNGVSHVTDATNASRTLLFNIKTQEWDKELLELFDIPAAMLPKVLDSSADFGTTSAQSIGAEIPINGVIGDQQGALVGQACFEKGMAKSTYGTGCFLMVNTGDELILSQNKLLTTLAYRLNGKAYYAIEGSIFVAGAAVQWLRDGLQILGGASETESIIADLPYDHGVYMVPSFTGLGAPHWVPDARGAILGLSRGTGIAEIVSASLQSIAYQTRDLQAAILEDGIHIKKLRVDGGMSINNWAMQFLSDMLQVETKRPETIETSALGAAYLAGLYQGVFESLEQIESLYKTANRFSPILSKEDSDQLYIKWQSAVDSVKSF